MTNEMSIFTIATKSIHAKNKNKAQVKYTYFIEMYFKTM